MQIPEATFNCAGVRARRASFGFQPRQELRILAPILGFVH